ncbi:MAG: flippase-like domain-containing protein [Gemmatimonadetes bacterium]|nr:flippase-like domain-containing protein [Gemmatimonadota bacterium]
MMIFLIGYLTWRAGARFPWADMGTSLERADVTLLTWAAIISLLALGAKGWAWHLLLRPVAPHRWWSAQEANLVGCAVNYISVAVIGEAARVRLLSTRDAVPIPAAVASVVWTRAMEGIGLALFILAGGSLLQLPPLLRGVDIAAAAALAALGALIWFRGWDRLPGWVPGIVRRAGEVFGQIGSWRRFPAPIALAFANWLGQWATYHLTLVATGIPVSPAASFTATLASNIGGALRLTPANVGITQASIAVALLPFGVKPAAAVAASIILQALQVLPVLALALGVVGWKGLGQLRTGPALET